MGKVYLKEVVGEVVTVSQREGLDEINHAMMGGSKYVRKMSQITRTDFMIQYKDGRTVILILVDAPEPEPQAAPEPETDEVEELDNWTLVSHRRLLHNMTSRDGKTARALCNKSFRAWCFGNGYHFKTRAEREADQYADLYQYCPRCEKKTAEKKGAKS